MKYPATRLSLFSLFNSLVLVLLCLYLRFGESSFSCSKYDSNMGANFDLSDLIRLPGQPSYTVDSGDLPCTTDKVEQNFTYNFNVCGAVVDGMPSTCLKMDGLMSAAAVQIDKRATTDASDDWCFLVGEYTESTTKLALINSQDPTEGLSLTYYGDYCNHPRNQRRFNILLQCADKLTAVPTRAYETSHCIYEVIMPSVYGCPLECPISSRRLCAGNGHCAYDDDKNGAKCFCNKGYTGADCATVVTSAGPSSLNYSPVLLGLIITIFVIIALLVGGILLMVRQVSAYKEDMSNYQVLKGGDDEHTTV